MSLNTHGANMLWFTAKITTARTKPHPSVHSMWKPGRIRSATIRPSAAEKRKIAARMTNVITLPSVSFPPPRPSSHGRCDAIQPVVQDGHHDLGAFVQQRVTGIGHDRERAARMLIDQ